MDLGLNIPQTATLDFLSLGALNHRVRLRHHPLPQSHPVDGSPQRR